MHFLLAPGTRQNQNETDRHNKIGCIIEVITNIAFEWLELFVVNYTFAGSTYRM